MLRVCFYPLVIGGIFFAAFFREELSSRIAAWACLVAWSGFGLGLFFNNRIFILLRNIFLAFGIILGSLFLFLSRYHDPVREHSDLFIGEKGSLRLRVYVEKVEGYRRQNYRVRGRLLAYTGKNGHREFKDRLFIIVESRLKLKAARVSSTLELRVSRRSIQRTLDMKDSGYKNYLLRKGIAARVRIYNTDQIAVLKQQKDFNYHVAAIAETVRGKLRHYVGERVYGLSYALVVGEKSLLSEETKEDFRMTGVYHVLAVSGMHAGILTLIAYSLLRLIGLRRKTAAGWVIALVLPLYVVVTGFQVSIIRTYFMILLGYLLRLWDREIKPMVILAFVFIGYTWINPGEIYSISFQLSFSAVFGIFCALGIIKRFGIENRAFQYILVSLGAQFFTAPILFYYFGYLNYFSLLYNIPVSFLIILAFAYSVFLALSPFGWISEGLGNALYLINHTIFIFLRYTRKDMEFFHVGIKDNLTANVCLFVCFAAVAYFLSHKNPLTQWKNNRVIKEDRFSREDAHE